MRILVTGGAGFIGSAVVRHILNTTNDEVLNLDKLTYAGNLESLASVESNPRYFFERGDICDYQHVLDVLCRFQPDAVMNLAAETHVDRSIDDSSAFVQTNIVGTYQLLQACKYYWSYLSPDRKSFFRFLHVSTDEVFGDLEDSASMFDESTAYAPSSPYSATKASSDHLVRAWGRTYQLPVLITNCSNNYGSFHFPEKLIPLVILNAIEGKSLPIYGFGEQVRDWLYVDDHADALYQVLTRGRSGETYAIGGHNQQRNIDVVKNICHLLDELSSPASNNVSIDSYSDLITFVADRPGHDVRYAIDASKIQRELGWYPRETFDTGLRKTVQWFLDNRDWAQRAQDGKYQRQRIGLGQ